MKQSILIKPTGKINRRSPRNELKADEVVLRENFISRDGRIGVPRGTQKSIDTLFSGTARWSARYYTTESGINQPVTIVYTQDGKLWRINDNARTATEIKSGLNPNAYPKHAFFKYGEQNYIYFVDGLNLYKYDGNLDYNFQLVSVIDNTGATITPIDVIEHKDRLLLLTATTLAVSVNSEPDKFDDPNDSLNIIVGAGRGLNYRVGKIAGNDTLYTFTSEGIFALFGDNISAQAATFEIRRVDPTRIISAGSLCVVERALVFLDEYRELVEFDGSRCKLISYSEKLSDFVNAKREFLDKAVSVYFDRYYMLSFVESGRTEPNLEVWYDTLEDKIDFVRGRHVSCYMKTDATREDLYLQLGRSDIFSFMWADRTYAFDDVAIVSKLRTGDITLYKKDMNCRVTSINPEFFPIGNQTMFISYVMDGKLSGIKNIDQNLKGEVYELGQIDFSNQMQTLDTNRPQINFSRGRTITIEINNSTKNVQITLFSIGIDFVVKQQKKTKPVGA